MEKLQTEAVAGCILLSSASENSLWRQNRLFLSVTWCVCVFEKLWIQKDYPILVYRSCTRVSFETNGK